MKKTLALLGCCLLTFTLLAGTAQAGAGCCPSKAKADKASCGPNAGTSADQAMTKTMVVDGKTVTCTVNADGSCTMPAGSVENAAGPGTKSCVVDGKTVTCTVNADGSCTVNAANASATSCSGPKAACGEKSSCGEKSAKKDKKAKKAAGV
jgi:hypothetical protein